MNVAADPDISTVKSVDLLGFSPETTVMGRESMNSLSLSHSR